MKIFDMLLLLTLLWLIVNLWLLPLTKNHWKDADLQKKIARAGALVVMEKVRDLSFVGATTLVLVMLFIEAANGISNTSFVVPKVFLETSASLYNGVKDLSENYTDTLELIGVIGAVITLFFSARFAKERITEAWLAKANDIYATLAQNPSEIDEAHQPPELQPVIQRLKQLLDVFEQQGQTEEPALTETDLEVIRNEISSLLSILAIENAKREVNVESALATPSEQEKQQPTTLLGRGIHALTSEQFCKDIGLVKKPLSRVVTGLLLISLLGWVSDPLANSLQLVVNNLRINILNDDAKRDFQTLLSQAKPPEQNLEQNTPQNLNIPPSAASIQSTTRLLAQAIARDITRTEIIDRLAQGERSRLSESEFVRAEISGQHIELPANADETARIRKEVADGTSRLDQSAIDTEHRLHEHLEQKVQPVVEQ